MSGLLRVLQIEDLESDAALIVRALEKARYQVEWERVEDAAGMRAALAERAWDVIISDYYLPQFGVPAVTQFPAHCLCSPVDFLEEVVGQRHGHTFELRHFILLV